MICLQLKNTYQAVPGKVYYLEGLVIKMVAKSVVQTLCPSGRRGIKGMQDDTDRSYKISDISYMTPCL